MTTPLDLAQLREAVKNGTPLIYCRDNYIDTLIIPLDIDQNEILHCDQYMKTDKPICK